MASNLDPAISNALGLVPSRASIASHGGSGFSATFKIVATDDNNNERLFFVKTGTGRRSEIMFKGEHTSLNAINSVLPSLCPRSYAYGPLSDGKGFFLATDFLDLTGSKPISSSSSSLSLAQKLVKLHTTPAPIPDGYDEPVFGFPVPTCCGDTEQNNTYNSSWADFYANSRLRAVLKAGEQKHGIDAELQKFVELTASKVVPLLLGDEHLKALDGGKIKPVLVHGDLWSGNHGKGTIGDGGVEEVIFDPSSSYSHSEFEFGIMRIFGKFSGAFEKKYYEAKGGKDEPVAEWDDRIKLYELYHYLNHYVIFGGSYRNSANSIMKELNRKYGG